MFETALLVGSAFGVRHAFEADHLAAIATLVEDGNGSTSTGAAWGVGHSIPILVLGVSFLSLDVQIPSTVTTGFEALVAVVLVALGVRVIAGRDALGTSLLRHVRTEDAGESGTRRLHLTIGGRRLGIAHSRADGESFSVGIVHGLAGSGGVVVALAATAPTVFSGAGFLAGFSVATSVSMAAASWGWGRVVGRTNTLRTVAGVASVTVGVLLFTETIGTAVPLRAPF